MGYFINLRFGVCCGPLSYQKYLLASDTVFVTESTLFIKRCMRNVFPLRRQSSNSFWQTNGKFMNCSKVSRNQNEKERFLTEHRETDQIQRNKNG